MKRFVIAAAGSVLALSLAVAPVAHAEDFVDHDTIKKQKDVDKEEDGWDPFFRVGATAAFGYNYQTVASAPGALLVLGVKLQGGLDFREDAHDWRNTLTYDLAATWNAPDGSPEEWFKSTDQLNFESLYLFKAIDWLGPFVRVTAQTTVAPSTDIRAYTANAGNPGACAGGEGTCYLMPDGTNELHAIGDRLGVSSWFSPTLLRQSAGLFAEPYKSKEANLLFRLGLGAQETLADGVLSVGDTVANVVQVSELSDLVQFGMEVAGSLSGEFEDGKISYWLGGEALIPFVASDGHPTPWDNTTVDVGGRISLKVVEWLSVDAEVKGLRTPQLKPNAKTEGEKWQVMSSILLTFGYTLVD